MHEKKDIPPVLPQKPGTKEIDVDDAMIEEPEDDAFEKDGQNRPGKGENKDKGH
jgi:hypothetical protein